MRGARHSASKLRGKATRSVGFSGLPAEQLLHLWDRLLGLGPWAMGHSTCPGFHCSFSRSCLLALNSTFEGALQVSVFDMRKFPTRGLATTPCTVAGVVYSVSATFGTSRNSLRNSFSPAPQPQTQAAQAYGFLASVSTPPFWCRSSRPPSSPSAPGAATLRYMQGQEQRVCTTVSIGLPTNYLSNLSFHFGLPLFVSAYLCMYMCIQMSVYIYIHTYAHAPPPRRRTMPRRDKRG